MEVQTLTYEDWADEVHQLARELDAVILAHNYQLPWIQDVADHVGDSLALSRKAASSNAEVIVFCGVHFMAETAKILPPERTVLLPVLEAGCSLADTVTVDDVLGWRKEHPGGIVVSYINTSAAVKAESDICCTSTNAVEAVLSLPEDREVFSPWLFLRESRKARNWATTRPLDGRVSRPCKDQSCSASQQTGGRTQFPTVGKPGMRMYRCCTDTS